ncbi:major facilitator superfamily protein [Stylonychia lemnae]|uniref:Major facilitator superfamily protein n=1 Tax=Stylonychia lemnae TaxID=5949 RepID=A0A078AVP4_STYLE|nr:major facilitator superfamily protein [Stylonychia lemnae]|eukprot:CDW86465.1 major facilitator superfamily protein [Stylonychia lemnae]
MSSDNYKNFGKATQCSIGFLVLFIAFNTCQNLSAQVLQNLGFEDLGNYSLGTVYLVLGFTSMISSAVLKRLGYKITMVIGGMCNAIWVLSYLFPVFKQKYPDQRNLLIFSDGFIYFIVLFSAFINGVGAAILWTALGMYISDCSTEAKKGFYFSYFWTFYMSSQVVGNLVGAYVIGQDLEFFFIFMGALAVVASISFMFLQKPINVKGDLNDSQQEKQIDAQMDNKFFYNVQMTYKIMTSKRMLVFLPQLFWIGMSISYYSSMITPIIYDSFDDKTLTENDKLKKALIAMVAFGFGEMTGGLSIGQIIDRVNTKYAVLFNLLIITIMGIVTIVQIQTLDYNWLTFIMTFLWGFQDSSVNTHTMQMLGFEFENNIEPYSVYNLVEAFGVFIFQLIETYIKNQKARLIYTIIMCIAAFLMCGTTYFFDFKQQKQSSKDQPQQQKNKFPFQKLDELYIEEKSRQQTQESLKLI